MISAHQAANRAAQAALKYKIEEHERRYWFWKSGDVRLLQVGPHTLYRVDIELQRPGVLRGKSYSLTVDIHAETGEPMGFYAEGSSPDVPDASVSRRAMVVSTYVVTCPVCRDRAVAKVFDDGTIQRECLECGQLW